ncbi:hypothetical protein [Flavobacterium sp.]|uniref:hypothetical protein n=1 Tax=Flavobacterium sp. TaxID=239 RepID=UPI002FDE2E4A
MKKYIVLFLFISIVSFGQEKEIKTLSTGEETIILKLKNQYRYVINQKYIKIPNYASSPLSNLIVEFDGEIVKNNYSFFKNMKVNSIHSILVLSANNSIVTRIKVVKNK